MRSLENGSEDSLGRLEIPRVGGECAESAVGVGIGRYGRVEVAFEPGRWFKLAC